MKPVTMSPTQLRIAEIAFWLALASSFFLLPDKLTLMSQVMIFGLFAVSLDMALGYAGILTVGHAAFFGAGAYAAGLLARYGWSNTCYKARICIYANILSQWGITTIPPRVRNGCIGRGRSRIRSYLRLRA